MHTLLISTQPEHEFETLVSLCREKNISCRIVSLDSCGALLSSEPRPDAIFIGPEYSLDQFTSIQSSLTTQKWKGLTILLRAGNFTSAEVICWSAQFNHIIFDINDAAGIRKKISNLLSLHRIKQEKQRFKELERKLEEESAKLVDVNVNNVKLLAEVNRNSKLVEIAHQDLRLLLDNLGQGFLTINREGLVQPGWSKAVESIFGCYPEGTSLSELLHHDEKQTSATHDWLEMVFDERVPFPDMRELGQLEWQHNNRFIEIDYRPIRGDSDAIERLIVIATDKTIEREFAEKAKQEERFSRMILAVVRDRRAFLDYLNESRTILRTLEQRFADPASISVSECFRFAHTLKGNSGAFHLDDVAHSAHTLEDSLGQLRSHDHGVCLFSENKEQYLRQLDELHTAFTSTLGSIEDALGHFDEDARSREIPFSTITAFHHYLAQHIPDQTDCIDIFRRTFVYEPIENYLSRFVPVVDGIAERMGKEVNVLISGNDARLYMEPYKPLLQSFIHIFRNALDHGIELPEEREMLGKSSAGRMSVESRITGDDEKHLIVTIGDDGCGIDADVIKTKAIERGLCTPQEAADMSRDAVLAFLFHSGFSTRDEVSEWSGRGVGLDAVAKEVETLNGHIGIESTPGTGTTITMTLPLLQLET